jgi:hypothetical protein
MNFEEVQNSWDELKKHLQKSGVLHSEYAKRRTEYLNNITGERNRILVEKLMRNAIATDVGMNIYLDYLSLITKIFVELGEIINNHNEVFSDVDKALFATLEFSQEKLFSAMKETSDIALVQELKENVNTVIGALESRLAVSDNIINDALFKYYVLNITSLYVYSTFMELLKTRDKKVALEILTVLIKFAIGLIPFADIPLLAMDLKDAIESKQKQISTASDVLNDLDDFYFSVFTWGTVVHVMMSLLEKSVHELVSSVAEKKLEQEIVKVSAEKVKARFEKIWNTLKQMSSQ